MKDEMTFGGLFDDKAEPDFTVQYPWTDGRMYCESPIRAIMWIKVEVDDDGTFVASMNGGLPVDHAISTLLDQDTLNTVLFPDDDLAEFMLENGIAPWQSFQVDVVYESFRDWETNAYDCEVSLKVLSVVPWSCRDAADSWGEWLGKMHMDDEHDPDHLSSFR